MSSIAADRGADDKSPWNTEAFLHFPLWITPLDQFRVVNILFPNSTCRIVIDL
jgi:hypothetical protein